jgi:hypothetical protein
MSVDSSLVDRIVRGVLHGLQAPSTASRPSAPVPASAAPATSASSVRLTEAVVTADVLEGRVPRGSREIIVSPKAILTPAALDVVRSRRLWVQRESTSKSAQPAAVKRLAVVVRSTPGLDRLLLDRKLEWRRELLGCPDEAATLAGGELARGEADVVAIFAAQHFRTACRANRSDRVRAVAVKTLDELTAARSQLRVNTVCIDPTGRADFELRRWLDAIARLNEAKPER